VHSKNNPSAAEFVTEDLRTIAANSSVTFPGLGQIYHSPAVVVFEPRGALGRVANMRHLDAWNADIVPKTCIKHGLRLKYAMCHGTGLVILRHGCLAIKTNGSDSTAGVRGRRSSTVTNRHRCESSMPSRVNRGDKKVRRFDAPGPLFCALCGKGSYNFKRQNVPAKSV